MPSRRTAAEVIDLDLDDAQLEQRAARDDGSAGLLRGIQLLLQDLIDSVQALGGQQQGNDLSLDDQVSSLTAQLTTGALSIDQPLKPNAIKCKSRFSKASAFTVSFGLDVVGPFPQATVVWTLGGNTITRTIDVTPGCMISGFAERVNVTVADNTNAEKYSATPSPYNVTITIAPMARPTGAVPPVFTALAAKTVLSAATIAFNVPIGANGLNVNGVSAGGAAQLRVDMYSAGTIGSTAVQIGSYEVDAFTPGFIPLIAGTAQVQITNEGGVQALVTAVFSIDG